MTGEWRRDGVEGGRRELQTAARVRGVILRHTVKVRGDRWDVLMGYAR